MDNTDAVIAKTALGQGGVDLRFLADQEECGDTLIGLERANSALDHHPTAMVSSHDIDRNAHIDGPAQPRSTRRPGMPLGARGDCQDLSAFVIAAGRTNTVRHIGCRALRASAKLRQSHYAVVRAAHALAASGRFSLRNTHNIFSF